MTQSIATESYKDEMRMNVLDSISHCKLENHERFSTVMYFLGAWGEGEIPWSKVLAELALCEEVESHS